jgi:hypothetical protein
MIAGLKPETFDTKSSPISQFMRRHIGTIKTRLFKKQMLMPGKPFNFLALFHYHPKPNPHELGSFWSPQRYHRLSAWLWRASDLRD